MVCSVVESMEERELGVEDVEGLSEESLDRVRVFLRPLVAQTEFDFRLMRTGWKAEDLVLDMSAEAWKHDSLRASMDRRGVAHAWFVFCETSRGLRRFFKIDFVGCAPARSARAVARRRLGELVARARSGGAHALWVVCLTHAPPAGGLFAACVPRRAGFASFYEREGLILVRREEDGRTLLKRSFTEAA